jgi:hypothetical protein
MIYIHAYVFSIPLPKLTGIECATDLLEYESYPTTNRLGDHAVFNTRLIGYNVMQANGTVTDIPPKCLQLINGVI